MTEVRKISTFWHHTKDRVATFARKSHAHNEVEPVHPGAEGGRETAQSKKGGSLLRSKSLRKSNESKKFGFTLTEAISNVMRPSRDRSGVSESDTVRESHAHRKKTEDTHLSVLKPELKARRQSRRDSNLADITEHFLKEEAEKHKNDQGFLRRPSMVGGKGLDHNKIRASLRQGWQFLDF